MMQNATARPPSTGMNTSPCGWMAAKITLLTSIEIAALDNPAATMPQRLAGGRSATRSWKALSNDAESDMSGWMMGRRSA